VPRAADRNRAGVRGACVLGLRFPAGAVARNFRTASVPGWLAILRRPHYFLDSHLSFGPRVLVARMSHSAPST
jgi:hypothetical protein